MKREIKRTVEGDGFERVEPAFNVKKEDLAWVKYPCYIVLTGNYSEHFAWSNYNDWEVVYNEDDLPYCQSYEGSFTEATFVETDEEAYDLLSSYLNYNYDDGSHEWESVEIKINVKGWSKTFYINEFFAGSNSYYSLSFGKTNTCLTTKEEINLYKKLINNSELIDLFAEFGLDWQEVCQDQIDYIKKFI